MVIELYQAEWCPFCESVRETLTALGVSYVIHNPHTTAGVLRNEGTYERLLANGGEDQLPFLVDTDRGESLYESDEIVAYREAHYGG